MRGSAWKIHKIPFLDLSTRTSSKRSQKRVSIDRLDLRRVDLFTKSLRRSLQVVAQDFCKDLLGSSGPFIARRCKTCVEDLCTRSHEVSATPWGDMVSLRHVNCCMSSWWCIGGASLVNWFLCRVLMTYWCRPGACVSRALGGHVSGVRLCGIWIVLQYVAIVIQWYLSVFGLSFVWSLSW